jgi:hypothetical protein
MRQIDAATRDDTMPSGLLGSCRTVSEKVPMLGMGAPGCPGSSLALFTLLEATMSVESRRTFLSSTGKFLLSTVALGSIAGNAVAEHTHPQEASEDGHAIDAASENVCGTCQFWGGMRKISNDKKEVIAQSMGWCNNPDSPNHQKLTAADHQMNKPGIWKKWPAL